MGDPRVLPDRRGYWQAKTKYGNEIVLRVIGGEGFPVVYIDLRGRQQRPEDFNGEWIAPVPSREAVETVAPVIHKLIDGLDEHWKTTSEGQAVIREALQLVAGLTGKGGV